MTEEEDCSVSTEEELTNRTWKKLKQQLQKEGFREGALKGQVESYQTGFDIGYAEGFRLGEALGFYKGTSSLHKHLNIENDAIIQRKEMFSEMEKDRACKLCQEKNLLNKNNVSDIIDDQKHLNDIIISNFKNY